MDISTTVTYEFIDPVFLHRFTYIDENGRRRVKNPYRNRKTYTILVNQLTLEGDFIYRVEEDLHKMILSIEFPGNEEGYKYDMDLESNTVTFRNIPMFAYINITVIDPKPLAKSDSDLLWDELPYESQKSLMAAWGDMELICNAIFDGTSDSEFDFDDQNTLKWDLIAEKNNCGNLKYGVHDRLRFFANGIYNPPKQKPSKAQCEDIGTFVHFSDMWVGDISNGCIEPIGNPSNEGKVFIETGAYSDASEVMAEAINHSLDGIAIGRYTRLEIWDEIYFQGEKLLEIEGPAVLFNTSNTEGADPYQYFETDWSAGLSGVYPPEVRKAVEFDREKFQNFSFRISKVGCIGEEDIPQLIDPPKPPLPDPDINHDYDYKIVLSWEDDIDLDTWCYIDKDVDKVVGFNVNMDGHSGARSHYSESENDHLWLDIDNLGDSGAGGYEEKTTIKGFKGHTVDFMVHVYDNYENSFTQTPKVSIYKLKEDGKEISMKIITLDTDMKNNESMYVFQLDISNESINTINEMVKYPGDFS